MSRATVWLLALLGCLWFWLLCAYMVVGAAR